MCQNNTCYLPLVFMFCNVSGKKFMAFIFFKIDNKHHKMQPYGKKNKSEIKF